MPAVVIENPVINSAFLEPSRHFRFTNEGISDEITEGRRPSEYFIPIAPPKKRGAQRTFQIEWIEERKQSAVFINQVRDRVALWRRGGHQGVTHVTRELLDHSRHATGLLTRLSRKAERPSSVRCSGCEPGRTGNPIAGASWLGH